MEHLPGKEAQVDYFKSPAPVLNPTTGKWGRPWIFRMTLSCSRHGYEEPMWRQQRDDFLRAHEHAFLKFGGVPAVVRLDNLKAGVARASLYDPDVNDVYAAFPVTGGSCRCHVDRRQPALDAVNNRQPAARQFDLRGFDGLEAILKEVKIIRPKVVIHHIVRNRAAVFIAPVPPLTRPGDKLQPGRA